MAHVAHGRGAGHEHAVVGDGGAQLVDHQRLRADRAQRRVDGGPERGDLGAAIGRGVAPACAARRGVRRAWVRRRRRPGARRGGGCRSRHGRRRRARPACRRERVADEVRADREHDVGVVEQRLQALVHPRGACVERMAGVEATLALTGGDHRGLEELGHLGELGGGVTEHHTAADPDRPVARRRRAGRRRGRSRRDRRATRTLSAGVAQRDRRLDSENASGGISISTGCRRPRCTRTNASCTVSGISSACSARRCHAVIGRTRSSWSSISCRRPRCLPMPARFTCPAIEHDGGGRRERGRQAGAGVVHADPGHDERHPGAAAGAGVAVGQVGGALLVAGGDELDRRLVVEARRGRAWSGRRAARTRA